MDTSSGNTQYIPGVCNIGRVEIQRRYRIAYLGMLLFIFLIAIIEGCRMDGQWRLFICIPVVMVLAGLVQARQRFCLKYGFMGVFSIHGRRTLSPVTDQESLNQDRKTAIRLMLKIGIGTILITAFYYFTGQMVL